VQARIGQQSLDLEESGEVQAEQDDDGSGDAG